MTPAEALLRVSPAVVEATIENGRAVGSFTVDNTDSLVIRIRVTPVHFRLDLNGQINAAPIDSNSLSPWLKVTPREFPLAAHGQRQVRYTLLVPPEAHDGSYWGGLEFLMVPSHEDSVRAQSSIHVTSAILVPITADKGKPERRWMLMGDSLSSEVTSRGVFILAPAVNTGNGRVVQKGKFEVRNSAGAVVSSGETDRLSIFPHSRRILHTAIPRELQPGSYDFAVTYTSEADGNHYSGSVRFEVPDKLPDPPQSPQH